jgi:2-polyprenyl-6-hydroxyphenyl methylase/3-demethylubiquinone-9 3-methyltransferase
MKSNKYKKTSLLNNDVFDKLSNEWWDENGSFKALHSFNLIRIKYLKNRLLTFSNNSLKNLKILDVGCGGGIFCEPLARLGANITGIDTNQRAINVARDHAKAHQLNINYQKIDIEDFTSKDKFDIITCMEVLEHVEDIGQIISKSKLLLKKNGLFIGSTINKTLSSFFFAILLAEKVLKIIPKETHEWKKFIRPNYLRKHFLYNGFSEIEIDGVLYNPLKNTWKSSKFSKINYIFSAQNS